MKVSRVRKTNSPSGPRPSVSMTRTSVAPLVPARSCTSATLLFTVSRSPATMGRPYSIDSSPRRSERVPRSRAWRKRSFCASTAGKVSGAACGAGPSYLDAETADRMIENALGTFELPLGVAVNFLINGKDYLIPMAIEEPSVIAAASNAAKIARIKGGFKTEYSKPLMIGQIQILQVEDVA